MPKSNDDVYLNFGVNQPSWRPIHSSNEIAIYPQQLHRDANKLQYV